MQPNSDTAPLDPVHYVKGRKWTACGKRAAISRTTRYDDKVTCPKCLTHVRKIETPLTCKDCGDVINNPVGTAPRSRCYPCYQEWVAAKLEEGERL